MDEENVEETTQETTQETSEAQDEGAKQDVSEEEAQAAAFEELTEGENKGDSLDINFLLDIPLQVTVELGKTKMAINDLLQLGQGSVIELPKLVGEPLEVLVNNKLVARGEAVMVNEKFGIRLTDIISPMERIEGLG